MSFHTVREAGRRSSLAEILPLSSGTVGAVKCATSTVASDAEEKGG